MTANAYLHGLMRAYQAADLPSSRTPTRADKDFYRSFGKAALVGALGGPDRTDFESAAGTAAVYQRLVGMHPEVTERERAIMFAAALKKPAATKRRELHHMYLDTLSAALDGDAPLGGITRGSQRGRAGLRETMDVMDLMEGETPVSALAGIPVTDVDPLTLALLSKTTS